MSGEATAPSAATRGDDVRVVEIAMNGVTGEWAPTSGATRPDRGAKWYEKTRKRAPRPDLDGPRPGTPSSPANPTRVGASA